MLVMRSCSGIEDWSGFVAVEGNVATTALWLIVVVVVV